MSYRRQFIRVWDIWGRRPSFSDHRILKAHEAVFRRDLTYLMRHSSLNFSHSKFCTSANGFMKAPLVTLSIVVETNKGFFFHSNSCSATQQSMLHQN